MEWESEQLLQFVIRSIPEFEPFIVLDAIYLPREQNRNPPLRKDAAAKISRIRRFSVPRGAECDSVDSFFKCLTAGKIDSKLYRQSLMDQTILFSQRTKCLWKYFDVEQDPRVIDVRSLEITPWIAVSSRQTRAA